MVKYIVVMTDLQVQALATMGNEEMAGIQMQKREANAGWK